MVWNAGFTFQEPIRKSPLEEKCDHILSLYLIWSALPLCSNQLDDGRLCRSCALCRTRCILYMHCCLEVTSSFYFLYLGHKLRLEKRD